ncbi:hypothetical protein V502_01840 [Pseudogymnoascus sp. VKM F-4520 (FW-2644)]|nr:hypothetical protein V502_01840 [Pseudogymnoascus sp. VKM F-4520 (FW-2644)]
MEIPMESGKGECKYAVLPSQIDTHFTPERPHGLTKEARQGVRDAVVAIGGLILNRETLKQIQFPFPADTSEPITALGAPRSNGLRFGRSMNGRAVTRADDPRKAPREPIKKCRGGAAFGTSDFLFRDPSQGISRLGETGYGTSPPVKKDEEAELFIIHEAFMSMIQEAQSIAIKSVVGKPALVEANRKERGKKSKKPFNGKMSRNTFRKYTTCWKQLLSYIVRCEDLEDDKQPTFKFTNQQRASLDRLMEAADQLSDYQEEGKSDDDEMCKEAQVNVQQALLRFCIALLDHNLVDNEYQSAIISGLAVLGVREDKGWDNPEDYTPKLSAVIKLSQLMVIQMAYQTRQDTIAERVGQGWSQERAEEECPGHVELVQGMCRKFMMLMDENGKPTPMDCMFEARTYGLHIRYSITADGNIRWKGNNMSIGDINCDMEQIRSMISGLIQGMPLPPIEWERLWDNPSEQATGWSFLKDIRNKFTVDGVEGSKTWVEAIQYTTIYSAIIKIARALVVEEGYQTWTRKIAACKLVDIEEGGTRDPSPMDWIISKRTYGMTIRANTTAVGEISWIGDKIFGYQLEFDMGQLQTTIQGVVAEARMILMRDLMMILLDAFGDINEGQVPQIEWANLRDNMAESKVGWSFLDDVRNQSNIDGPCQRTRSGGGNEGSRNLSRI